MHRVGVFRREGGGKIRCVWPRHVAAAHALLFIVGPTIGNFLFAAGACADRGVQLTRQPRGEIVPGLPPALAAQGGLRDVEGGRQFSSHGLSPSCHRSASRPWSTAGTLWMSA